MCELPLGKKYLDTRMSFGALNVYVQTSATDDTTRCKNKSLLAGVRTGFLTHTCALADKQPSITDSCISLVSSYGKGWKHFWVLRGGIG